MNQMVPFDAGELAKTEDEFEAEEALCEARMPGSAGPRFWNRVQSGAKWMAGAVWFRATPALHTGE